MHLAEITIARLIAPTDDPQLIPNLTVWDSAQALWTLVQGTLHALFMARQASWFEVHQAEHFAMSWVPKCHPPTIDEVVGRIAFRAAHGDSAEAVGWDWLAAHPSA